MAVRRPAESAPRPRWLLLSLLLLSACGTSPRTEVVLLVSTDYAVPSEVDAFNATVDAPDMEIQTASATLSSPSDEPRTLGLVYRDGPLGPFDATIQGMLGGGVVATRRARFTFQEGRTLVLRIHLSRSCESVRCAGDETCEDGACRPILVAPDELQPWPPTMMDAATDALDGAVDSAPPDAAMDGSMDSGPMDAGVDAEAGTLPTCDSLFADRVDYDACDQRPSECEFFANPASNMSCGQVCAAAGETCVSASIPANDTGRNRCNAAMASTCDALEDLLLCVCSRTPR